MLEFFADFQIEISKLDIKRMSKIKKSIDELKKNLLLKKTLKKKHYHIPSYFNC